MATTKLKNSLDLVDADGSSIGLHLGGVLMSASAAELNKLDGVGSNITISYAASATTDGIEVSYQVVDAAGTAVAGVHVLNVFISRAVSGASLTTTTASGSLTVVTGEQRVINTAKKDILAATDANGLLVIKLVDSSNTAGERFCAVSPLTRAVIVGDATVSADYEGGA